VYVKLARRSLIFREGRVCLSLLGTWHSHNDTESWNPRQSTLLQLFLSIQSLVLTARPYYNEAGFATHIGLDESSVNERLYSERAYCLSRGFVKYALENAVEGLEQEVRYLYLDEDGPQLGKAVIEDGKQVIARSEIAGDDDGEWERGRVTRVSRGGLEVLKRTISVLEGLIARSGDKIGS
jgi:ubiquitin-conjugating enzyme E2 O